MLPDHLKTDIEYLLKNDRFFKSRDIPMPDFSWRRTNDDFSSLVRIVLGQQVSTNVANILWDRLQSHVGKKLTPEILQKIEEEDLRELGISRQKISYLHGLCDTITNGNLSLGELSQMNDEDVAKTLMALRGFGLWSAQMYLIFTLARPDIWPAQDLIIRDGVREYLGKEERPDLEATRKFAEKFKGRRTALALLMWGLKD